MQHYLLDVHGSGEKRNKTNPEYLSENIYAFLHGMFYIGCVFHRIYNRSFLLIYNL